MRNYPIYLDYQATTPMDPKVLDAMMPFLTTAFGNPHSRSHSYGWEAEEAVESARKSIASLIGANEKEIIFTSGATESNNLAIKGLAEFHPEKKHIITVCTEHKSVLDTMRYLASKGYDITYLPVEDSGVINLDELKGTIRPDTLLVSIMMVNNEIGVLQPITEIGTICKEKGIFFHTDAAQAFGKIPIDVEKMGIDLMSISGHKIYGPKGIGALYVRRKNPRVRIVSLISGGGQERGMRSGTLSPALVVGLGKATEIAKENMKADYEMIADLSRAFIDAMLEIPAVYLNGDRYYRYPGCLNFSFSCIEGESMIGALKDLAVSSGSACTSASLESSYVLKALGVDEELAHTSIRFGIGRFSTLQDIKDAIEKVQKAVTRLRDLSPLWEMMQEGIDLKSIQWDEH